MAVLAGRPDRVWRELRYRRLLRRLAGRRLVRAFADAYPEAFFVEIGANDGDQHDHLRPMILTRSWKGIMVEPVPYVFERLRRNYGDRPGVILENVAIADRDAVLPFYHLAEPDPAERQRLPEWYDAVGSFSPEAVLRHARQIPDIHQRLVRRDVPCMTFPSLCRRHDVHRVDVIQVDTEGYDWEIVRHLDLPALRPRLVVYEHYHLSPGDRAACREYVEGCGYQTMEEGFDTWCLDATPPDRLTRIWRRLTPAVVGVSIHDELR